MRLLFIVSILLVATSAFGQDARRIKTEKIDGLICTNFSDWRVFTNASNFWTPTTEQVIEAEREIESYLKKDPKFHSNDLWRKLPDYQRQYVGVFVDGHKRVFCNFFKMLPAYRGEMTQTPFIAFDGGESFFRIQYDLDDKHCYGFEANGNA